MGRGIFPAWPLIGSAEIFLLAVGRPTVVHEHIALTMRTMNRAAYHDLLDLSPE